jgi:glycosyltransferase 2 family protein
MAADQRGETEGGGGFGLKRAILSILIGLALSAVGIIIAASQVRQPPKVEVVWPIALGILAMFVCWTIQGSIIALLSRPRLEGVKVLDMTRVYLATQTAGAITPFAGGEIAYQLLELDRRGLAVEDAGAVITIRSVLNGAVLIPGAVLGLFLVPKVPFVGATDLPLSSHNILLGAAIAIAAAGVLVMAIMARRRKRDEVEPGWLKKTLAKISDYVRRGKDYGRHVRDSLLWIWREQRRVVFACGGLMALYWVLYPLLGTLALRATGWDGSGWIHVYLAQYVLFLIIPLAPTPGNSGAAELAFVTLMSAYVPHGALLGGVIIWRILNHYSEQVVGGFIAGRHLPEDVEVAKREFGSDSD